MMNGKIRRIGAIFCAFSFFCMLVFTQNTLAETRDIWIDGDNLVISPGGTIDRFLVGMTQHPGKIRIRSAFHVDNGINEFEKIRIELIKGNRNIQTNNCYSIHAPSNLTPKCDLIINISQEIADIKENYIIKVHNNTSKTIKGFNINKKGFDALVPDYKSTFTNECPSAVNLIMSGTPFSLEKGQSITRDLLGFPNKKGFIKLRAKWHTVTFIPNFFVKLKIELLKPDGSIAKTYDYYSYHAPNSMSPKFDDNTLGYTITQKDSELTGKWKIRVRNISNDKIDQFNITKGSDSNPMVKNFNSTFLEECK